MSGCNMYVGEQDKEEGDKIVWAFIAIIGIIALFILLFIIYGGKYLLK